MPVSRAQTVANLFSRYVQKPSLRLVAHQPTLRRIFALQAMLTYRRLEGTTEIVDDLAPGLPGRRMVPKGAGPRRLFYLHGGGFTIGGAGTHRWLAARLAAGMGGQAVLPDYRLAPEHPFPAGLEDCLTAYRALLDEAPPERIAVAGDSAGGGLALSLLGRLRAAGLPPPAALGLLSPAADLTGASDSCRDFARTDMLLSEAFLRRALHAYLAGTPPDDPEVSPLFADLSSAPPTLIQAAEGEILHDDALRLAKVMPEAEVDLWQDVPHVWQLSAGRTLEADRAVSRMSGFFDRHLAP